MPPAIKKEGSMKAYEIIDSAFALAGERFDEYQNKDICLKWLNSALSECVAAERMIRRKNGPEDTVQCPKINGLNDEVEMSADICKRCLPYALASYIYADRQDEYFFSVYRNRFISSLSDAAGAVEKAVTDCYGGEAL